MHLCERSIKVLFGPDAKLTPKRDLSQIGQYLSEERVNLIGPKGRKDKIAVLGPLRKETQVELSKVTVSHWASALRSDSREIRKDSGAITIEGPRGTLEIKEGVIIAQNHVHMTPESAGRLGLKDNQHVKVAVFSERPIIYRDVVIRISEKFRTRMHIDFDEANAALISGFTLGRIIADES